MNAGSQMFSASTQVQRLDSISEKMAALQEALGTKIGTVEGMLKIARDRALKMERDASSVVSASRTAKNEARDARIAGTRAVCSR